MPGSREFDDSQMLPVAHRIRRFLASPFARHPYLLQRSRWPNPLQAPWKAKEINLYRPGEFGDVLMCLAIVREIRQRNSTARITLVTKFTEFFQGHPLLDRVCDEDTARRERLRNVVSLRYEVFIPLRLHVIDYLGGCVGLRNVPRIIELPDFSGELAPLTTRLPTTRPGRPRVAICRHAGPFTPNKNWPAEYWDALIHGLSAEADIIELGTQNPDAPMTPHHFDLRGQTNLRQFCAIIARSDLVITPVTSSVHVAAAYGVPVLSVIGGYENPENTAYLNHTPLHRAPACSPCWLPTPCPFDRKCLRDITVAEVLTTAREILKARNLS